MSWTEQLRFAAELRDLRGSTMWRGGGAPDGRGRGVVLVPGFGNPPVLLAPLARWLRAGGWEVVVADLGFNTGCGEQMVAAIGDAVATARSRSDRGVAVVGHSRGGLLGRVAAVRLGDEVEVLVTLATPWQVGPPDTVGVRQATQLVRFARRHGFGGLASIECGDGTCCTAFRADMEEAPAASWTAAWSRRDTVAGRASAPPACATRAIDLGTTHLGALLSVASWRVLATALTPRT